MNAGIIISYSMHGIWEIDNSTGFYGTGTENPGKGVGYAPSGTESGITRCLFGRERI